MLKMPRLSRHLFCRMSAAVLLAGLWSALPAPMASGEPESLPELGASAKAGSVPTPSVTCPKDMFDWLDTTATWPLSSIGVGDQTYTRDQLTRLFDDEDLEASDASIALASEIVAAKLNRARGITWQPLADLLARAEAVLAGQGALPIGLDAETAAGRLPLQLAESLASYNEGDVTSSCATAGGGAASLRKERDGEFEILCPIRDKDWVLERDWPVKVLEIGSKTWTENELREIMVRPDPGRTRPRDMLVSEVAAARLNQAAGVASPGLKGVLVEADRVLDELKGEIEFDVCSSLAVRLKTVAARLEILNSPYSIKGCRPPEVGLRDLPDIFDDPVIGACPPPDIWGMAELHTHMFAEHSYNGSFIGGTVDDHQSPFLPEAQALERCSGLFDHAALRFPHFFGMGFVSEKLVEVKKWNGNGKASTGDTGIHLARRNGYDTRNCYGVCTGPGTCVLNGSQAACLAADPGFCQDDVPGNISVAGALACNTKLSRAACEGAGYCGATGSSLWSVVDDLNPCWASYPNCDAADTCLKRDPFKALECNDLNQNECNNHPNECNWNAQCKHQSGSFTCSDLNQGDCNQYTAWCNWSSASCTPDSITTNLTCGDLDLNDCSAYPECGAISSCKHVSGSLTCSDLNKTECATYNECSWYLGSCRSNVVNGSLTCSDLTQAHCGNHSECAWTTECKRLYGSFGCSDLNQTDCNQYGSKCDWNPGSCYKDPLVLQPFECNDLTQADCGTYSECGWEAQCKHPLTAQSLECSDLTPTECANHWNDGGCGLRDCSEVGCAWTDWGQCQWQAGVWPPNCGDHYRDWPAWDTPTHQQHYWGHLQDAWRKGLRVVSVSILEVDPITTLMPNGLARTPYEVIMDQIDAAEAFAQDHQAWVEIAYSAAQARQIAQSGKLAMVLTLEGNFPFCKERPCGMGDDEENLANILTTLDEYVARGIRGYQVMSHFDTQFAGVAVYKKPIHLMQWFYEELSRDGVITSLEMAGAMNIPLADAFAQAAAIVGNYDPLASHPTLGQLFPVNGFDELTDMHALMGQQGGISGLECVRRDNGQPERCATCLADQIDCQNVVGLTPLGEDLVRALIDRHVMIDIAHLSERGVQDVWNVIQTHSPTGTYPIYVSHGDPRDALAELDQKGPHQEKPSPPWVLDLIEQSGGMFGMRTGPDQFVNHPPSLVDNDCSGSTKSFSQAVSYLVDRGLDVGFALDMNGMIANAVPRFVDDSTRKTRRRGRNAVCLGNKTQQALQAGPMVDDPTTPHTDESRFNTKGFGHIGLLGAFVDDLDTVGLRQTYLDHLYGSAEAFVQMWENVP